MAFRSSSIAPDDEGVNCRSAMKSDEAEKPLNSRTENPVEVLLRSRAKFAGKLVALLIILTLLTTLVAATFRSTCCNESEPPTLIANASVGSAMLALRLTMESVMADSLDIPVGFKSVFVDIVNVDVREMRAVGGMELGFSSKETNASAVLGFNAPQVRMKGGVNVKVPMFGLISADFVCDDAGMSAEAKVTPNGSVSLKLNMTTGKLKVAGLGKVAELLNNAMHLERNVQECAQRALQKRLFNSLHAAWDSPVVDVTIYSVSIDWGR